MYLLQFSDRMHMTLKDAMQYSFPPKQIAGLLFPNLYSLPTWWSEPAVRANPHFATWGLDTSGDCHNYAGAFLFALALVGWLANLGRWRVHLLFWTFVLLVLCNFGEHAPFYPLLYKYARDFPISASRHA
jgi:hypothetical protein